MVIGGIIVALIITFFAVIFAETERLGEQVLEESDNLIRRLKKYK